MAESSPGLTYAKLSWLQAWHIRDETYSAALAELVNHQYRHAFAAHWGDGTTSSSDGQRFRAGGRGESTGHVNPKYGSEPGRLFYTHISDQYAPFSTRVVNVGVRDSTYVLDGLLYHESDLRIDPLQSHFFNTLQAGELLYERMKQVLQEPAPAQAVLTCFHRVLLLGFRGRYQDPVAPERDQLISTLNGLVAPFGVLPETAVLNVPLSTRQHPLLHSPFFWLVTLTLLLAGVWWGLHHWLNVLVDELLPQSLR